MGGGCSLPSVCLFLVFYNRVCVCVSSEIELVVDIHFTRKSLRVILPPPCTRAWSNNRSNIFHCGPVGCGEVVKICNNLMLGISMIGASEMMNFGVRCDPPTASRCYFVCVCVCVCVCVYLR